MSSNSDEPSTSGIGFIGTSKEPPRKKRKVADLSIDVSCSNSNISHAFVGAGTANHAFYQYNSTEREIAPSIQKLKEVQVKFEKERFLFNVTKSSYKEIQNIYPKMMQTSEDALTMKSRYVPSSGISHLLDDSQLKADQEIESFDESDDDALPVSKQLSVEDILAQTHESKILNLIGLPGSGKTTISRRLSKIVCKEPKSVCILVKFMDLNYRPLDRGTTLYFIHQTLQEYLAALYIHYVMSDDEFAEFVERKLFHSHWIVVRKFLFGIIFDLYKNTDTSQRRKGLMKNALVQEIQKNPDFEKREVETLDE